VFPLLHIVTIMHTPNTPTQGKGRDIYERFFMDRLCSAPQHS